MSNQNPYEYQSLTEDSVNERLSSIEQKINARTKVTTWWNPETNKYYSTHNPDPYNPHYDIYVCDGALFGTGLNNLKGASAKNLSATEIDQNQFRGIRKEFQDQANLFWSDVQKVRNSGNTGSERGAGVITTQDYSDIANVIVDATSYEKLARDFILEQAVTIKNSSKLVYTADDINPYLNEADMGENDVMDPRSIDYDRVTATLKKAQGHVKASKWAELAIRDHNVVQDNFSIIDADFPRIFATDIATTLLGFADNAAGTAYDVIGAGDFHSTKNPMTEFLADSAAIRTAGGMANTVALNSATYQALTQNTFIRPSSSILGAVPPFANVASRVATNPQFPGYTFYIDELLTTGHIFVYDKRAVEFIRGPTRTSTLNDDYNYFISQISDRWYTSLLRNSSWGSQQTGTTT